MTLGESDRAVFAAIADIIVPAWERMPAASAVGVHTDLLDTVLRARPDLADGVHQAIEHCRDREPSEAVNSLYRENRAAFDTFTLAVTGGYYMADKVRVLLGYPGQESPEYDPYETAQYLTDGILERVTRRGSIYRPTPR
jgi:hypothetical protein